MSGLCYNDTHDVVARDPARSPSEPDELSQGCCHGMKIASFFIVQSIEAGAPRRLPFPNDPQIRLETVPLRKGRDDEPDTSGRGPSWHPIRSDASVNMSRETRLSAALHRRPLARGGSPRLSSRNATPTMGGALGE